MTGSEIYSGLYIAITKISYIQFADTCARIGAPGTSAQWFIDRGCLLTDEGRNKLNRVYAYVREQLTQQMKLATQ